MHSITSCSLCSLFNCELYPLKWLKQNRQVAALKMFSVIYFTAVYPNHSARFLAEVNQELLFC